MLSKRDRERLYQKAADNCGVKIIDSTPAFFYGTLSFRQLNEASARLAMEERKQKKK